MPSTQSSAQGSFWEHRKVPSPLCASVDRPVRECIYPLPWVIMRSKEYTDRALGTFKPLISLVRDEHLCLLFAPRASVHPLCHSIRPQIPMSARYKKRRSCYGINLVLPGKAERSKKGPGQRRWGRRGKAARRARPRDRGLSHLQSRSRSVQGSGSDSPSVQALGVGLLQDLCGGALLFCRNSLCWLLAFVGPAGGGGRSLASRPRHGAEVPAQGNGGGSRERLGAPCWLRKVGSQRAGTGKVLACHCVRGC